MGVKQDMAEEHDKILTLIKHGGAIGGATTGSVLGFLAGGPIGAAIGGAIGATLQTVATEIVNRELSHREEMRVGGTASYAIDFIHDRLKRGDRPREDTFFVKESSGNSPAEEIFEGVLLKAKGDHEERKARFYGLLFANVSFDADCSQSEANYLLHLMDGLTFLQLALVSLFSDPASFPQLPATDYQERPVDYELLNALAATFELYQNGILRLRKPGDESGEVILDIGEIRPAHMTLSATGKRLFELAGLAAIGESSDLQTLADLLAKESSGADAVILGKDALRNK
jgi:hypothetical protein